LTTVKAFAGIVVLERRAVENVAEVAVAVDARELSLHLPDLLDLVLDLGDVVHHLLDRLHQVGNVDHRNALGVYVGDGQAGRDGERGEAEALVHGTSRGYQARPRRAARR
jgi:hypothetical protein